jgi:predicted transcriptional regulator
VVAGRALPGGKLEYAVLVAVWERGVVTAREVHEQVGTPAGLVYTTTARVLDRLHAKGLVERERDGKVFRYRAAAARTDVERGRLSQTLTGVLGGGRRSALAALVEAIEEIDPALLEELARTIDARRRSPR